MSAEQSLELPELYIVGQKDELFNYWVFLQAIGHGMATSLVNFFMTLWISHDSAGPVSFSDYQSFAVVVALSGLLSITMEVGVAALLPTPRGLRGTLRSPCSVTRPFTDSQCRAPTLPMELHPGLQPTFLNSLSLFRSSSSSSTGRSCPYWPFSSASASMWS